MDTTSKPSTRVAMRKSSRATSRADVARARVCAGRRRPVEAIVHDVSQHAQLCPQRGGHRLTQPRLLQHGGVHGSRPKERDAKEAGATRARARSDTSTGNVRALPMPVLAETRTLGGRTPHSVYASLRSTSPWPFDGDRRLRKIDLNKASTARGPTSKARKSHRIVC